MTARSSADLPFAASQTPSAFDTTPAALDALGRPAPTEPDPAATPAVAASPSRAWASVFVGLMLSIALALIWGLHFGGGAAADEPAADVRVIESATAVGSSAMRYPAGESGAPVALPDEWAASRPGYRGAVWYRLSFDLPSGAAADALQAAYVERACTNLEVHLNGQLLYRGGRMAEPVTRNCYRSHVVPLPAALLQPAGNVLDVRVVGEPLERVAARQHAGALSAVQIGPQERMLGLHERQMFWSVTLPQIIGAVLVFVGGFALMLARVRRLGYLMHFGLLCIGWFLQSSRIWLRDIPLPAASVESLITMAFAPLTAFGVKFLLGYAGYGFNAESERRIGRWITAWLWLQCALVPASFLLVGADSIFVISRIWYWLMGLQVLVAVGYFVLRAGRSGSPEYWIMCGVLGLIAFAVALEIASQEAWVPSWGANFSHFVMPLLFCAVAVRLVQVYVKALQTAMGTRQRLELRIQQITTEIERNFHEVAEMRVEQIAEKERKRIAADLHDDLGAKLLTIVHTSDNDRISTLAREALEEMRLSVRGLTGRPVQLADALADWRSETVSRLGQAGIDIDWVNPPDMPEETLSARIYVQTTRIVREATSNIIKHAGASHVVISCAVEEDDFQLVIQDNGRGIPLELDGKLDRGHGMASMKHRAKQLNGQCLVESGPGLGTIIRLTLPLDPAHRAISNPLGADTIK